ncbi:MAG: hypothetical protein JXR88_00200 [Clostridia bacterium]|nr:hypothetical protein [Clostridia bacterium]
MKKKVMILVAMLTAFSLLAVLAFAGTQQENGYTLFKEVLKAEDTSIESGSVQGFLKVTDNGETLFSLKGQFEGNFEEEQASGQFTMVADGFEKTLDFYGANNLFYIIDALNETAYVGTDETMPERHNMKRDMNEEFKGLDDKSEAILDLLIGDMKHEFEIVEDTDGTLDVQFELTEEEIPALINLLLSLDDPEDMSFEAENSLEYSEYPLFNELENLEVKDVTLEDIQMTYLNITLDLDADKTMEGISVQVKFQGKDEFNVNHEVVLEGQVSNTESENVEIQVPDLTGYTIYEVNEQEQE